jgi:hypothetical protein
MHKKHLTFFADRSLYCLMLMDMRLWVSIQKGECFYLQLLSLGDGEFSLVPAASLGSWVTAVSLNYMYVCILPGRRTLPF